MKRIITLCIFCVMAGALSVQANNALPASKSANDKITKAEKILKETFAVYKKCKSYQHEAEVSVNAVTRAGQERSQKKTTRLIIEKPNKIFFQWISFVLVSDGKQIQVYMVPLQQYIVKPVPAKLSRKYLSDMIMMGDLSPVLNAIYSNDPYKTFSKKAKHIKYAGEVKLGGKTCWKIEYVNNNNIEDILIDKSTHLIKKITIKPVSPKFGKWSLAITYTKVKLNVPVDESEFKVVPPAGARKVERFSFTRWFGYPMEGKVLPDVSLPDLQSGKDVSVKSQLGKKVTFVTFWASWCPPCRMEIPELQKLYEKYKNKGFQVIGINLDNKSSIKRAVEFAKQHKLTFPTLNDNAGKLASPMKVSSIPTMLIVDANGKIIEAHRGYNPQGEKEFSGIIEKMISASNKKK